MPLIQCECGYTCRRQFVYTKHLNGIQHYILLRGGTQDEIKQYTNNAFLLRNKIAKRDQFIITDPTWTSYNVEIECIANEMLKTLTKYVGVSPIFNTVKQNLEIVISNNQWNNNKK